MCASQAYLFNSCTHWRKRTQLFSSGRAEGFTIRLTDSGNYGTQDTVRELSNGDLHALRAGIFNVTRNSSEEKKNYNSDFWAGEGSMAMSRLMSSREQVTPHSNLQVCSLHPRRHQVCQGCTNTHIHNTHVHKIN